MEIVTKKISFNRLEKMLEEKNLISFNRKIENRHVKKMTKSILQCGVLRDPVVGDISAFDKKRKYVLVDAQHLSKAIINSNFNNREPINCKVKKYNNMSEVINDIAVNCRYQDCTHTNEKGCAVIEAVEEGVIDRASYENYLKIEREKEHFESTVAEKRKKDKEFGKMIRNYKNDIQKLSDKHKNAFKK